MEPITKIEAPARAAAESEAESTLPRRVIKRYSNRKLYDTKDSRYVTLLQIAELVRAGDEVQIIDNNSKEDLTEVTLAQIIYEEQKAKEKTLPLKTLKDLIHQRTEDVLSSLREGPIGRLIPGAPGKEGEVAVADRAAAVFRKLTSSIVLVSDIETAEIIKRGLAANKARIAFPLPLYATVWLLGLLPPGWTETRLSG